MADDAADVGQEAHVKHVVGFVQNQDLEVGQADGSLPDVIQQPPGARDHDVGPMPKFVFLGGDAHPAVDRDAA